MNDEACVWGGGTTLRILIIDDSKSSLAILRSIVEEIEDTTVETFLRPADAMARIGNFQFDLVLVDYMMPKMDGIAVTQALRASEAYRLVPVIMVTSEMGADVRLEAVAAGATDFIHKPFDPVELKARVRNLLSLRSAHLQLADRAQWLSREVEAATRHLVAREEEVIWRLARAIEYRDGSTGEHVSRVALVCRLLAEGLKLDAHMTRMIYLASPLHDIGKIGIADAILGKPGRLTDAEMNEMRRHVKIGVSILENGSSDLIRVAEAIAGTHHERWDGRGYPNRLGGEAIPIEGRIVALADVFDALCSERPYKPAWPIDKAYDEIVDLAGSHFDPAVVKAFQAKWPAIVDVMLGDPAAAA
jgi:putative two-component system response regulator